MKTTQDTVLFLCCNALRRYNLFSMSQKFHDQGKIVKPKDIDEQRLQSGF